MRLLYSPPPTRWIHLRSRRACGCHHLLLLLVRAGCIAGCVDSSDFCTMVVETGTSCLVSLFLVACLFPFRAIFPQIDAGYVLRVAVCVRTLGFSCCPLCAGCGWRFRLSGLCWLRGISCWQRGLCEFCCPSLLLLTSVPRIRPQFAFCLSGPCSWGRLLVAPFPFVELPGPFLGFA